MGCFGQTRSNTPHKTNDCPLKIDAWKRTFPFEIGPFLEEYVNIQEGSWKVIWNHDYSPENEPFEPNNEGLVQMIFLFNWVRSRLISRVYYGVLLMKRNLATKFIDILDVPLFTEKKQVQGCFADLNHQQYHIKSWANETIIPKPDLRAFDFSFGVDFSTIIATI